MNTISWIVPITVLLYIMKRMQKKNYSNTQQMIAYMKQLRIDWKRELNHISTKYNKIIQELNQRDNDIYEIISSHHGYSLNLWFQELESMSFRNEAEVEVKFIYPLLRFLGYKNEQIKVRQSLKYRFGRNKISKGYADWVIRDNAGKEIVIEAKPSTDVLTDDVRHQASSYAVSLRAPLYVLTNGRRLEIFERRIDADIPLTQCAVEEIPAYWQVIEGQIGANSGKLA